MSEVEVDHDGSVSTIRIARPDKMNALDTDVLEGLRRAIAEVGDRKETRCAVMTGEGKAFVAGADISAMKEMGSEEARRFARLGHETFDAVERLGCPVIAAVNGFALGGGCELALACDFAYASEKAKFGQPETKLGVIPGFGGTQRLSRRVGSARARELIYTGEMIDAHEALRFGLVNRVVAPEELMSTVRSRADAIAANGPLAVESAKAVIREGADRPLDNANALEIDAFAECFPTADREEGMDAFLAKRDPRFEGR